VTRFVVMASSKGFVKSFPGCDRIDRLTYSIVARDPATGEMGVAVQSHWFSVGSVVPWAEPGLGAVATQSIAEPAYGPRALDLLRAGASAEDALRRLVEADSERAVRQVAVVDAHGRSAVHTGRRCIQFASDVKGRGFTCQANMMANDAVWGAMAEAYSVAQAPMGERLLVALDAGEAAGGDVRGRQSAALVIVPPAGEAHVRAVDLRVEDHADPLGELRRLVALHRAYELAGSADELVAQGRHAEAADAYRRAADLEPGNDELLFWAGLAAVQQGDREPGLEMVRRAISANDGWRTILPRLSDDIAPSAAEVRAALGL
jgi:uncharacterized Ntn-hydrolase superfamily protein